MIPSFSLNRRRTPLEPEHKLVVTLRFLATGAPYRNTLQWDFCIPHNTLSSLIKEVCTAIYEEYRQEVFALPSSAREWKQVAQEFSDRWNYHHCLGAIDGKHIMMKKPPKSGTRNYNYKGFFSVVLLAVVDAQYRFVWCSVGAPGSASDGGIFKDSTLYLRIQNGTLHLPAPEPLEGQQGGRAVPYFFVGDDAFALSPWMMKPFPVRNMTRPERLFNYRLSRARRIVENGFGILANQWRCLTTKLGLSVGNTKRVTKACITLHNVERMRRGPPRPGEVDMGDEENGAWRDGHQLEDNDNRDGNRGGVRARQYRYAQNTRNYLMEFYASPAGAVPWQDRVFDIQRRAAPVREVPDSGLESEEESEVD